MLVASFVGYGAGPLPFLTTAGLFVRPMTRGDRLKHHGGAGRVAAAILWGCTSPLVGLGVGCCVSAVSGPLSVGRAFVALAVIPVEEACIYVFTAVVEIMAAQCIWSHSPQACRHGSTRGPDQLSGSRPAAAQSSESSSCSCSRYPQSLPSDRGDVGSSELKAREIAYIVEDCDTAC